MYEAQNGLCGICSTKHERLHVDHCHKTGRVRKLLCIRCNAAIGYLNDNQELVTAALIYLKEY